MKAMYTFYAMEKGFVIERDKFEEFVKTQNFIDLKVEFHRLPINTWPEGTNPLFSYLPVSSIDPFSPPLDHQDSLIPSPFLLSTNIFFQLHSNCISFI